MVDLSYRQAFPYVFLEAFNALEENKYTDKQKKTLINKIEDVSKKLWRFYDALSKSAAQTNSFLIHYIDSSIHFIVMVLLDISQKIDELDRAEIISNIGWLESVYWRIYDYAKEITHAHHMYILDHLLEIGYRHHQLSVKGMSEIIVLFASIAGSLLEKGDRYGFESIRAFVKAAYLCALVDDPKINFIFVSHAKAFLKKYEEKFPKQRNTFFKELDDLYEEEGGRYTFEGRLQQIIGVKKLSESIISLHKQIEK
jgi:hypothetical protein